MSQLDSRVKALEAELADATKLTDMLNKQLLEASQAKEAAEAARREATAAAQAAAAEITVLSRKLVEQQAQVGQGLVVS